VDVPLTTLRLRFRYTPTTVTLEPAVVEDMVAPSSPGERPEVGVSARMWVELQDDNGEPLTHRLLRDPFGTIVEEHREDGSITRHDRSRQSGRFEVLMPEKPEATKVVLWSVRADDPDGVSKPQSFPLVRRGGAA